MWQGSVKPGVFHTVPAVDLLILVWSLVWFVDIKPSSIGHAQKRMQSELLNIFDSMINALYLIKYLMNLMYDLLCLKDAYINDVNAWRLMHHGSGQFD